MLAKVPVDDQLVALSNALERAQVSHAFSGWIAHAYYTVPRRPEWRRGRDARGDFAMRAFGVSSDEIRPHCERLGIELHDPSAVRSRSPLEIVCGDAAGDRAAARRIVRVPFGEDALPILSAEDLIVDELRHPEPGWQGLEQLLFCRLGEIDTDYLAWALKTFSADDPRRVQFDEIVRAFAGAPLGASPSAGGAPS